MTKTSQGLNIIISDVFKTKEEADDITKHGYDIIQEEICPHCKYKNKVYCCKNCGCTISYVRLGKIIPNWKHRTKQDIYWKYTDRCYNHPRCIKPMPKIRRLE